MGKRRIKFDFLVHDLKVPLAIIEAGVTSLIKRTEKYGPLTDKQLKVLNRTLRNTLVTRTIVNDALEVGRSSEGIITKSTLSISNLIEESLIEIFDLTSHSTSEDITKCVSLSSLKSTLQENGILLNIDEDLWCKEVCLDESKMRQILRNLLNNALKYRKESLYLDIEEREGTLVMSVKDDGDGIPKGYHQKIFECYFQMDMEADHCVRGHGLGLAGVMVLVEDMGGQLLLDSDEGSGAAFSVRIPLEC